MTPEHQTRRRPALHWGADGAAVLTVTDALGAD